jgi:hypothetical protein
LKLFFLLFKVNPEATLGFKSMNSLFSLTSGTASPFSLTSGFTAPLTSVSLWPPARVETDPVESGITFRSVSLPDWPVWNGTAADYDKAHHATPDFAKLDTTFKKVNVVKAQCEQHLDYCTECGAAACHQDCGAFAMGDPSAPCTCQLEDAPFPIESRDRSEDAPRILSLTRCLSHVESADKDSWKFMLACKEGERILHNYWFSETYVTFTYLTREGNVFYRDQFVIIKSSDFDAMPHFAHNYSAEVQREVAEFVAERKEVEARNAALSAVKAAL